MAPTSNVAELADFLRARITEDEEQARDRWVPVDGAPPFVLGSTPAGLGEAAGEVLTFDEYRQRHMRRAVPDARALAECELKRWIVDGIGLAAPGWSLIQLLLERVAQVYSKHPDFKDEWRH